VANVPHNRRTRRLRIGSLVFIDCRVLIPIAVAGARRGI